MISFRLFHLIFHETGGKISFGILHLFFSAYFCKVSQLTSLDLVGRHLWNMELVLSSYMRTCIQTHKPMLESYKGRTIGWKIEKEEDRKEEDEH